MYKQVRNLDLRVQVHPGELLVSKSVGAHSTRSLKISGCKRWCSKDLRVRAPAAPVLTHSLLMLSFFKYLSQILLMLSQKILEVTDSFICGNGFWLCLNIGLFLIHISGEGLFLMSRKYFVRLKMISQNKFGSFFNRNPL